jgi:hypothetical protein
MQNIDALRLKVFSQWPPHKLSRQGLDLLIVEDNNVWQFCFLVREREAVLEAAEFALHSLLLEFEFVCDK